MQTYAPAYHATPVRHARPSKRTTYHGGHMLLAFACGVTLTLASLACYLGGVAMHKLVLDVEPTYSVTRVIGGYTYVLDHGLTADDCAYYIGSDMRTDLQCKREHN